MGRGQRGKTELRLKTRICRFHFISMKFWRRQWHPTPVLLPGKSHGRRSLVGCSPWGHEESDRTERLHFHFSLSCIGEGNGNPLQCSCLENPRDWGDLVGCRLWGRTESDTTEVTKQQQPLKVQQSSRNPDRKKCCAQGTLVCFSFNNTL